MENPYLIRGSADHLYWEDYFNKKVFTNKCKFPFIVRLINSFLITGQEPQAYIPKAAIPVKKTTGQEIMDIERFADERVGT